MIGSMCAYTLFGHYGVGTMPTAITASHFWGSAEKLGPITGPYVPPSVPLHPFYSTPLLLLLALQSHIAASHNIEKYDFMMHLIRLPRNDDSVGLQICYVMNLNFLSCGNPQAEAMEHTRTCLQPESGDRHYAQSAALSTGK